jgi:hypothetical protein
MPFLLDPQLLDRPGSDIWGSDSVGERAVVFCQDIKENIHRYTYPLGRIDNWEREAKGVEDAWVQWYKALLQMTH